MDYSFSMALFIIFQILLVAFGLAIGGTVEVTEWLSLKAYENYVVYSLPLASVLYLAFATIGAFVEEVALQRLCSIKDNERIWCASWHRFCLGDFLTAAYSYF